ncbi:MAG: CBS domain-containing protein [Candidatus Helarchaeota archaeon]
MTEFLFEPDNEKDSNYDIPLKTKNPIYNVFLCYFDEARGHLPLYTYPEHLKCDENIIKIIKIHSIWFLDTNLKDDLQHVDLEYHNRLYLALKFLGKSWREKSRAGLEKETPETYVLILSVPKQFSFLGSELIMNLYSKIQKYKDELYILIKKEHASYKVIKSEKDLTIIKEGKVIEEELNKCCKSLLPEIPEDLNKIESITSAETRKNQKLAYLFLKELSQTPPSEPRKFEISVGNNLDKKRDDRNLFIKPIIIKSIETIEGNQKLQIILKNQTKNLRNIRIQISRIEEFFETSSWETTIDIWFANEELIFKYPITDINEKFQLNVENSVDGTKLLTKDIIAKDYLSKKESFFDIITAKDFMDKKPLTISYSENIKNAVIEMNKNRFDYIIITLDEKPIGIITHRDILKKVIPMMYEQNISPNEIKCKEIMSTPLIYVNKNDNIRKAALLILQTGVKKLPVLEDDKLVGIIRTNDLINVYLKQSLKSPDLEEKYSKIADLNKRTIEKIMNRNVIMVNVETSLIEIANIMNEKRIGSVVVSKNRKAIGIITERNILRRAIEQDSNPKELKAQDLMNFPLITLSKNDTIEKAIHIMITKGIRHIIITEENSENEIEGIISNTDILNMDISTATPPDLDLSKAF